MSFLLFGIISPEGKLLVYFDFVFTAALYLENMVLTGKKFFISCYN